MRQERKAMMVRISGHVQRVGFRAWTSSEATKLGLAGWVRNESDGSVKALIVGSDAAVQTMMKKFWIGPSGALVADVVSEPAEPEEGLAGFKVFRPY